MNTNINHESGDDRTTLTVLGGFLPFAERFQKSYARLLKVPDLEESEAKTVLEGILHELTLDMTGAANYLHEQLPVLERAESIVGTIPLERKCNAENMLSFFEQHLVFAREISRMFGDPRGDDNDYTRQLERAVELSKHHVKNNGNESQWTRPFSLIRDHQSVRPPATVTPRRQRAEVSEKKPVRGGNWVTDSRRTTAKKMHQIIGAVPPEKDAE